MPDYIVKGATRYRVIDDQVGSPRLIVNVSDGTVAQQLRYDEFGRVLVDTNPGFQPFGFAGGLYDRDTGLIRYGARDYDPRTGRWTSPEPLGFISGELNFYVYAANDPINTIDPDGLAVSNVEIAFAAGGAVLGMLGQAFSDIAAGQWSPWKITSGRR